MAEKSLQEIARMATKGEWQTIEPAERTRTYHYGNGETIQYRNVSRVKVSESGNHYLEAEGVKAIVAPGWRAVELDMDTWTF